MLLTSMVQPQAYRSEGDGLKRLVELMDQVDPLFAAKAAIYARTHFGMRSITHATAAHVAKRVKAQAWTRKFFKRVVLRVDDVMETIGYYLTTYGWPLPN